MFRPVSCKEKHCSKGLYFTFLQSRWTLLLVFMTFGQVYKVDYRLHVRKCVIIFSGRRDCILRVDQLQPGRAGWLKLSYIVNVLISNALQRDFQSELNSYTLSDRHNNKYRNNKKSYIPEALKIPKARKVLIIIVNSYLSVI